MRQNFDELPNGYLESINNGIKTVRAFRGNAQAGKGTREEQLKRLKEEIQTADAIVIGGGAGLSTSAGLTYSGERFERYKPVYQMLLDMVKDRDYFVITTNVDHQFLKAGFDKERLFYTQGDYGLWQCSKPCHKRTYDNKGKVVKMLLAQGFVIGENSELIAPVLNNGDTDFSMLSMRIPSGLIPYCPVCGEPMSMNLRADNSFVEDRSLLSIRSGTKRIRMIKPFMHA